MGKKRLDIKNFKMYKNIVLKVRDDKLTTLSASLAYYFTLATFPALVTIIEIIPFLNIDNFDQLLENFLNNKVPDDSIELISNFLQEVLSQKRPGLLSFTFLGFIWASSQGMDAVIELINHTYDKCKPRNFLRQRFISMTITLIYGLTLLASTILIVANETYIENISAYLNSNYLIRAILIGGNYLFAYSLLTLAFGFIYFIAPTKKPKVKYVIPGSISASLLLVFATLGFNFYISNIGNYSATYGSLGGTILYMIWLYIVGFTILFGAVVNVVIENSKMLNQVNLAKGLGTQANKS